MTLIIYNPGKTVAYPKSGLINTLFFCKTDGISQFFLIIIVIYQCICTVLPSEKMVPGSLTVSFKTKS